MPETGTDGEIEILVVEGDEQDYLLTKNLLSHIESFPHRLDWVSDYASALAAVRAREYDVCLVDHRLGQDDGIELVRELVSDGDDTPMIVLTGRGDADVHAADAGAADYLVKAEISPVLLERTIRYAIRSHAQMRALRESEEGMRHVHRLEALGQLAGGVAHDFNNIMTAVVGFAELALVRMPPGGEQLRPYLEEIKRAGERAGEIAHQLLAFSRKQVLQTRVLDLNALVRQVEALLEPLLADDIELDCRLDPDLAHVEADPAQIEQVLVNLAVNASDAMPRGGRLTIETATVELGEGDASRYLDVPPGSYVRIAMTDTGVGMDAATMKLIFEPFFTTKDVGEGTGLGLATVFGIVKQSGGDIGVCSEPGRGSTFKVYLPCVQASLDAPLEGVLVGEPPGGSETILLVDDEELVRSFEREVLLDGGYTVLEASGPRYALALSSAHSGEIDLLVTDVVMPRMSGRELAEAIAGDRPGIKTLYVSGYPSGAITRHGVLEDGIAFLPKPLTRHALARKVREVLDAPT